MVEIIFWFSIAILFYVYFGYPLAVIAVARFRGKPVKKADIALTVSIIIAAYNEEKHIAKKIENILALYYPKQKLEIIVASDASTDKTNDIIKQYANQGIKLVVLEKRMGKTEAQNRAIKIAKGEILFFTDVTTIHPQDALEKLVRNFFDPEVGCVTGQVTFRDLDKNLTQKGLKTRLTYETYFRSKLAEIYSMLGATGCIYAIRRELCEPLRVDLVSDLVAPLKVLERGFRTVYEPEALALVDRPTQAQTEFARRTRVVVQGLRALFYMKHLGNPFRYGFFVSSMYTHRLIRWLAPTLLLVMSFSNILLLNHHFYQGTFLLQLVFYLGALLGFVSERKGYSIKLFSIPFYFCLTNASCLSGLIKCSLGEKGQVWEPVGR